MTCEGRGVAGVSRHETSGPEPDISWTSSKCWARVVKCCSWGGRGWEGGGRRRTEEKQATFTQIFAPESIPDTSADSRARPAGQLKEGELLSADFSSLTSVRLFGRRSLNVTGALRVKFCSFLVHAFVCYPCDWLDFRVWGFIASCTLDCHSYSQERCENTSIH